MSSLHCVATWVLGGWWAREKPAHSCLIPGLIGEKKIARPVRTYLAPKSSKLLSSFGKCPCAVT